MMKQIRFIDIPGIKVGHAQNINAATGCTVVLCEKGAVAGVDVRGGSPGTRETDSLNPINRRQNVHAVILSGGSAYGLDAAAGVMQFLEEKQIGRDAGVVKVPVVCGAILFDLHCGDWKIRPDKEMGYEACMNSNKEICIDGSVGAGTGATVGKVKGMDYAMKGGIGTSCYKAGDLIVGALMAVNCVGDILDTKTGNVMAGVLNEDKMSIGDSEKILLENYKDNEDIFSGNTIIGTVVTNARLSKSEVNKLASISHNGIARAVRPAHSIFDGDTIFSMATQEVSARFDAVAVLAAKAVEAAIVNGVRKATSIGNFTTYQDLNKC